MLNPQVQPDPIPVRLQPRPRAHFFDTKRGKRFDLAIKLIISAALAACIIAAIRNGSFIKPWILLYQGKYVRPLTYMFVTYSFVTSMYLIFRTFLWLFYKPYPVSDSRLLPKVTIVIPAYNEGEMVEKTIESAATAGYPRHLIEIICVDDGSKDDTFYYMQRGQSKYPGLVRLIKLPKNMGKRHALYAGFVQAKGDVIITIDSDSIIEKGAIHHIVAPFTHDSAVGAVAGNVKVLNRKEGLIPKMLGVSFVYSFDFTRACESTYGTVECCPGAFSAYRGDLVREVMDSWLNQHFLGKTCTYGEDRALTNFILRKGFLTVYQSSAKVFTEVPTTYGKMAKMFLRWERSNIRESIILGGFIASGYRKSNRILPFLDFTMRNIRYPVQYYAIGLLILNLLLYPFNALRYMAVIGVFGTIFSMYYIRTEKDSDFLYGIFYCYFSILALQWIFPYAFCTLKSRSWMTR